MMNKETPLNLFHFNAQRYGFNFTINFPTFFSKAKEILGIDLQPIVIPLLVRLVKSEVERLKAKQDLKLLTKQGELDLKNFTN
jgi:hypothetical protein